MRSMPDGSVCGELSDAELVSPAAVVRDSSDVHVCWPSHEDKAVKQKLYLKENTLPDHLALVIDTSAGMEDYREAIASVLTALPKSIPATILLAGDETEELCRARILDNTGIGQLQSQIRKMKTAGGQDSGNAIRHTWNIPYAGESTVIVWIHGPQSWGLDSGEKLRQMLERQQHTVLIDFQTENGPHRLIEKIGDLNAFRAPPRIGAVKDDLKRSLSVRAGQWRHMACSSLGC